MSGQEYTVAELLENDSFRRWVRGEASVSQKEYWDTWVMTEDQNRRIANEAMKKMTGFTIRPDLDPNNGEAWNRFRKRLDHEDQIVNPNFSEDEGSNFTGLKWVYRIAAGILLILTTGMIVYYANNDDEDLQGQITKHRILTEYGEQKTIRLRDGSTIDLNANSELVYKVNPSSPTNINVELKGEAFFNVKKRMNEAQSPFQVKTSDGFIRVLGTEFAVSTRDEETRVVLEEGSVEVTSLQKDDTEQRQVILKPNHLASFDDVSDTLIVQRVNTKVYTSWKTEELVFDHTPLPTVLKRIEYTFGVDIKLKDPALKNRTLSGRIKNSNMNVILSTLSQTLSTQVEIKGDIVYLGND